jgi:hypothetical protein
MAGRALGTAFGQGDLGALAGESLAKLFGYGDYRTAIKGNSLMAGVSGNAVPKFEGNGKRGVRLTEREFIGNIVSGQVVSGSSLFTNQSFPINPTNPDTFPWLSKMANLFDQWEPHGIVFEFHTTSSTFNGTSQALGAVIMATEYDFNDADYPSKQIMENADYACSSVPSTNLLHGVECDPHERPLEILYTSATAGQENFNHLGKFQIATQGCSTAGTTLGELWISYDITFYKKQMESLAESITELNARGTASIGGPLFVPSNLYVARNISYTTVIGTGTKFTFPPSLGSGLFQVITMIVNSQAGDQAAAIPANLINCTLVNSVQSFFTAGQPENVIAMVSIAAPGASFTLGLKNTTSSAVTIQITEVDKDTVFI